MPQFVLFLLFGLVQEADSHKLLCLCWRLENITLGRELSAISVQQLTSQKSFQAYHNCLTWAQMVMIYFFPI